MDDIPVNEPRRVKTLRHGIWTMTVVSMSKSHEFANVRWSYDEPNATVDDEPYEEEIPVRVVRNY